MTKKKDDTPEKDHPDQAIDTPLPTDFVDEDTFAAMAAEYEPVDEDLA
jgi:hypothetical protein